MALGSGRPSGGVVGPVPATLALSRERPEAVAAAPRSRLSVNSPKWWPPRGSLRLCFRRAERSGGVRRSPPESRQHKSIGRSPASAARASRGSEEKGSRPARTAASAQLSGAPRAEGTRERVFERLLPPPAPSKVQSTPAPAGRSQGRDAPPPPPRALPTGMKQLTLNPRRAFPDTLRLIPFWTDCLPQEPQVGPTPCTIPPIP